MILIAGLGNPGEKYSYTKHNIGFMLISKLAEKYNVNSSYKFDGLYGDFFLGGEKVLLFEPMKYMNKSGKPIFEIMDYYGIGSEDLLVVHDDLDLELGQLRFKRNGSSGGHNGIKSIINSLGTKEFKRLKIGIGRPPEYLSVPDYVLTKFAADEKELVEDVLTKAVSAVELMIKENIQKAMNKYNG